MPKGSPIITNFTAGEFSPKLDGRTDVSRYFNAAKTLFNMIVYPHGGATRRGGTQFVLETQTSSQKSILIPFEFSTTAAYIIEAGHNYMRFFTDRGNIVAPGGSTPYEISTTINEASLPFLRWAQSSDTMYIVSSEGDMPPAALTRTDHNAWTFADVGFTNSPWNGATVSDFPAVVGFFEQRSVWTGMPSDPQRFFMSRTAGYTDMTTCSLDDDGIDLTIAADQVNAVKWMASMKVLIIGTSGGEWRISSESYTEPISPTNILARRESNVGAADALPVIIGTDILYVARHNRKVRSLGYDLKVEGWTGDNLSIMAEHLTGQFNAGTITGIAFQREPDSILWAVRSDGDLLGLTYNKAQEVIGWHHHETDGEVESIAIIPGSDYDELWAIIKRTDEDNIASRFVEFMRNPDFNEATSAWFVDSGLQYDGNGATIITGLDHLAGSSVAIFADGGHIAQQTVTNGGSITVPNMASVVTVGLPYTSRLQTMRLDAGSTAGTSAQTKIKRVYEAAIRLFRSAGFKFGSSSSQSDTVPMRTSAMAMGFPPDLFTGDKVTVKFPADWDRDGFIWVEQENPLPLTVTAIVPSVETEAM